MLRSDRRLYAKSITFEVEVFGCGESFFPGRRIVRPLLWCSLNVSWETT